MLLEVIGPELQSIYDDRQIEVGRVEYLLVLYCIKLYPLYCYIILDWICRYALWHWHKSYEFKRWLRSICALWSSQWDTNMSSCIKEYFLHCKYHECMWIINEMVINFMLCMNCWCTRREVLWFGSTDNKVCLFYSLRSNYLKLMENISKSWNNKYVE